MSPAALFVQRHSVIAYCVGVAVQLAGRHACRVTADVARVPFVVGDFLPVLLVIRDRFVAVCYCFSVA